MRSSPGVPPRPPTKAPVPLVHDAERWMDAHAQLGPARHFVGLYRQARPRGGGAFLDNGCSLDGRQLHYMASKLDGALAVGVQVERDFPYVMEQPCERCALLKLRPEGEALPFGDGVFDGVLSVNVSSTHSMRRSTCVSRCACYAAAGSSMPAGVPPTAPTTATT